MNIQVIDKEIGQYQISKGITKKQLERLACNPKTQSIQFESPLSLKEIELLENVVFSKRADIELRVYGHYHGCCDLTFLQLIPSLRKFSADCLMEAKGIDTIAQLENLEQLGVGIMNLEQFDFLDKISPNLKVLSLHQTSSKKPNISSIERFEQLEYLYLEGQQNGIEAVSKLRNLERVVLRSISTNKLDFLSGLEKLWSVDIKLGSIKDYSALSSLKSLKYLELWQVKDLTELSFISKIETLQNLHLQTLKKINKLPDFSNNKKLRRIYLENLKSLNDFSSLNKAVSLKEFIFIQAENQEPEKLLPVLQNSAIEKVLCGFGSIKKNKQFDELAKQYNKLEYKFSEFEYE